MGSFIQRLSAFELANLAEAILWSLLGVIAAILAVKRSGPPRRRFIAAAPTLVLFGASDLVEMRSGAWWRPWWLLAWKGACLGVFAIVLYRSWRESRRSHAPHSDPPH